MQKRAHPGGTQYVIGLAQGESPYKMRSVKVKKPVIEYHIRAVPHILNPDGGMPVQLVYGLAGLTGEQVCVYTVSLCLGSLQQKHQGSQKCRKSLLHVNMI